jgi:hypothetical protein
MYKKSVRSLCLCTIVLQDFGDFMKSHKLVPLPQERTEEVLGDTTMKPCQKGLRLISGSQ